MLSLHILTLTSITLFLSVFFIICFIIEILIGKLNKLAPLVVVLIAPITKYVFDAFGFKIRLLITEIASNLLNFIGYENFVSGNLITTSDGTFSVDIACMGLKMIIASLLICLLLISFFEKRNKIEFKLLTSAGLVFLTICIVIIANFFRIIALIILKSPPETFLHEAVGIISLFAFVIFPLYLIINYLSKKSNVFQSSDPSERVGTLKSKHSFAKPFNYISIAVLILALIFSIFFLNKSRKTEDDFIQTIEIKGYNKVILDNNVAQFISPNVFGKPSLSPPSFQS